MLHKTNKTPSFWGVKIPEISYNPAADISPPNTPHLVQDTHGIRISSKLRRPLTVSGWSQSYCPKFLKLSLLSSNSKSIRQRNARRILPYCPDVRLLLEGLTTSYEVRPQLYSIYTSDVPRVSNSTWLEEHYNKTQKILWTAALDDRYQRWDELGARSQKKNNIQSTVNIEVNDNPAMRKEEVKYLEMIIDKGPIFSNLIPQTPQRAAIFSQRLPILTDVSIS